MAYKRTKFFSNGASLPKSERLRILASEMISRAEIARRMGYSYKDKRDIYDILGYERNPQYDDFYSLYRRAGLAKRIINAPVTTSWRGSPTIIDANRKSSTFEKAWDKLVKEKDIYNACRRADRLARIGRFSILLLGLNDGKKLSEPVGKATELLYLQPYGEKAVEIGEIESNISNARYGLPLTYQISISSVANPLQITKQKVHYSRVIHIAEDILTNNIYGEPALECVFNNLQNIELISGGSSEMFWRGALPGLAFKADPDAQFGTEDDLDDLEDEIQEYLLGLKRYLRLQGIDIEQLSPQVSDPSAHITVQTDIIAATIGIPKRILMGSERGELASSQDQIAWYRQMDERRVEYNDPVILRPLINRLIGIGVLPESKGEYSINWKSLFQPTEHEKALIAKTKSDALLLYAKSMAASKIMPPKLFLKLVLGLSDEETEEIEDMLGHKIGAGREKLTEDSPARIASGSPAKKVSADPRKLKQKAKVAKQ